MPNESPSKMELIHTNEEELERFFPVEL